MEEAATAATMAAATTAVAIMAVATTVAATAEAVAMALGATAMPRAEDEDVVATSRRARSVASMATTL
jgi:hypothetical protein